MFEPQQHCKKFQVILDGIIMASHCTNQESLFTSGFPHKVPVMQSFDVCFVISLNQLWNKQLKCQWFEMPWPSLWYLDISLSVIYPQGFCRVKFVIIPPDFVQQQYLWNIAIPPAVSCYNIWANINCLGCSPPGEKSLWNRPLSAAQSRHLWDICHPFIHCLRDSLAWFITLSTTD